MDSNLHLISNTVIRLNITHSNLNAVFPEIKFSSNIPILEVKHQLSFRCGTNVNYMKLILKSDQELFEQELSDDNKSLRDYNAFDGYTIHVIDMDPNSESASGWLEDVSKVKKFELSDDAYNQRTVTFRNFKKSFLELNKNQNVKKTNECNLKIGERCKINPGDKRGYIKYVGEVHGLKQGIWIGIELDEPMGKNDGSLHGKRYFNCSNNYGSFVRPHNVEIGNFPSLSNQLFSDEIIDEI